MHARGRGRTGKGLANRIKHGSGTTSGLAGSQGTKVGDSSTLLRMLTDGERSFPFRTPLQMRRFLGEALTHCKMYDASRVLQCLGSPETAGSQRLIEICHFPHSVSAGVSKTECSFRRVCYNPILATVANNLDLKSVCHSAEVLAAKGSIVDPEYCNFHQEQDGDIWQPANWVQLLQPVVSFLSQVIQRFGCKPEQQLEQMLSSVASLQQTAHTFK
ncbi:hypothetical protein ABBQ32_013409 [Trebouxia sp. C0010 RCD-2024]